MPTQASILLTEPVLIQFQVLISFKPSGMGYKILHYGTHQPEAKEWDAIRNTVCLFLRQKQIFRNQRG